MHITKDTSSQKDSPSHRLPRLSALRLRQSLFSFLSGPVCDALRTLADRVLCRESRTEAETMQTRLLAILDNTPDLVALYDIDGCIRYCNKAGRQMLRIEEEEEADLCGQEENAASQDTSFQDTLFPIGIEQRTWQGERVLRSRDGHDLPVSQVVIAHKDEQGHVAYLSTIARDISERQALDAQMQQQLALIQDQKTRLEAQKAELILANRALAEAYVELADVNLRLETLATTDGLTGLMNHRAFQERLADEFARANRHHTALSLLLLDVDRFKQYNDTFGHPAGDEALKAVAAALDSNARQIDFVARYGGEEFVIILPETDERGALEAAERLRQAIGDQRWEHRSVTVSVGIATYRSGMESAALLIDEADKALYISKELGRNRVSHYDTLHAVISRACHTEAAA